MKLVRTEHVFHPYRKPAWRPLLKQKYETKFKQ